MTKTSSSPATPRNTTTSRKCSLKIRTTIKSGVLNNPLYQGSGGSGSNPLHSG